MSKFKIVVVTLISIISFSAVGTIGTINAASKIESVSQTATFDTEATEKPAIGNGEEATITPNPRSGYRWHCKTCGYTSAWHMFANTAVKAAQKHMMTHPGHVAYTYSD